MNRIEGCSSNWGSRRAVNTNMPLIDCEVERFVGRLASNAFSHIAVGFSLWMFAAPLSIMFIFLLVHMPVKPAELRDNNVTIFRKEGEFHLFPEGSTLETVVFNSQ